MTFLILGGTGKTGRRLAHRLTSRGLPVRLGSRAAEPPFDWHDPATWPAVVDGVTAVYVTYQPDLGFPGAAEAIRGFTAAAVTAGVRHVVLLSGRNEEETWPAERAVRESGAAWTILRASWFAQNFSEFFLLDPVMSGTVSLPGRPDLAEPFVDVEDIADVAAAVLTDDRHAGRIYELTGPRALTFPEALAEIASASGRAARFVQVSTQDYADAASSMVPAEEAQAMATLFAKVLDGRNSRPTDDIERILARPARDFTAFATAAAKSGAWS